MISRRSVLLAGAAVVTAALGGSGYALLRSPLETAREPWARPGGFADPRLNSLSWAVLAPSPHNRQPWRISLRGADTARIFCALDSRLPRTDPFDRQITIGFGAFLELARMAAAASGRGLRIVAFPEGAPQGRLDERPVADLVFAGAPDAPESLFDHALDRRTTRAPFAMDDRPDDAALARLAGAGGAGVGAGWTSQEETVAALRDLCLAGWGIEHAYPPTHRESAELTRVGSVAVNAQPDGISIAGPAIEALRLSGAFTEAALKRPGGWASAQVHDAYAAQIAATPAFVWIATPGDGPVERLAAGRAWLRIQLAAARDGWAFHPISQVLQEFAPMEPLREALHAMLAPDSARVHGLFRIGRAPSPHPSPRWPVETRLIDAV